MARAAAKAKSTRATKAKAKAKSSKAPTVEELYFRSDSAYLCLILNRRTNFTRVIDFRAGALPAKRLYIQSVAKQEGIVKVITLVEKDEVSSWTKVGFVREGTIPGFYKRSDGHLCGCVIGERTASEEVSDKGVKLTDRTINAAKKAAKDFPERIRATTYEIEASDAFKARDQIWKKGKGINAFDTFGRDAARGYYETSYKKTKPNFISVEYQDCFGHSLIEVLRSPENDDETKALVAGLRDVGEELKDRGIVSSFAFAPNDDVILSTAFVAAGYRKTGLLAQGIIVGDERKDAILWTRKLANPAEDE
ncbi:MAG: hypothetical protein AAGE52_17405 [Myxococcota bacterium]